MTENKLSLFLKNNTVDNDETVLCHEIVPHNNDLYFINEHLIRQMPKLDSAVVIVLKRALFYKDGWFVRFLPSHDVKHNGDPLQEGDTLRLMDDAKITVYECEFSVFLSQDTLPEQSSKPLSPIVNFAENEKEKFITDLKSGALIQHNSNKRDDVDFINGTALDSDSIFQLEVDDSLYEGNLLDIISVGEHFNPSMGENADILKVLEHEYERVLVDPYILIDKKIDHSVIKNQKILKSDDYFNQGQLIAEESTEELIDGRLGIDEIEQLLGADFNNELFKTQGNDDILLLYATTQQKEGYRKSLPSANKKDFYAVTLRTLLSDVNFQTETIFENSEEADYDT
jgi:hypothetical protein